MREEEHLQECRELIAENIRRYETQVEERHRQTQELVKAVQSGNVELYDQMFTSQSLEEHSRNQLAHNKAASLSLGELITGIWMNACMSPFILASMAYRRIRHIWSS